MRIAEWTPGVDLQGEEGSTCPLYLLNTANDLFGCEVQEKEYDLPSADVDEIISHNGFVDNEVCQYVLCTVNVPAMRRFCFGWIVSILPNNSQ